MFFNNFKPLLYKIHNKIITVLPYHRSSITDDDSYVIDIGREIYICNGKSASHTEIYEATILAGNIQSARTVFKSKIIIEISTDYMFRSGIPSIQESLEDKPASITVEHINIPDSLVGTKIIDFTPYITDVNIVNGKTLNGNDSYIITCGNTKYIWIGKESNNMEANLAWDLAVRHISLDTQVSIEREGNESMAFKTLFH